MIRNFFKSFLSTMLALMMVVSLAAVPSTAATIKLNYSSFSVTKGYAVTLKVSGTSSKVKWTTGNKEIATVSSSGKVVGKSLGSTYIYAKVNGTTLKSKVTVVAGKITVGKSKVTLDKGESVKVKIKAIGTHTISVSSSNKNVVKASWNGAKFDGNYVYLTLTGKGDGTAKVKVFAKKYPKTIYKYINVTVGNGDVITDEGNTDSSVASTLTSTTKSITVDEGKSQTFTVTSTGISKLKAYSMNTGVAMISVKPSVSTNSAEITVTGVKAGTTSIMLYISGNITNQLTIPVTVAGNAAEYYVITDKTPTKLAETDKVLQFNVGNAVKYMLLPEGYDIANVNQLIAENINSYQYYTIYTKTPAKKVSTDSVVTINAIFDKKYVVRYMLLPEKYDSAKMNDISAEYSGMYDYYCVYSKSPTKNAAADEIVSWKITTYDVTTGKFVSIDRYMLLPMQYDKIKADLIIEQDKSANSNADEYAVLDEFPSSYNTSAYQVFSWMNTKDGRTKYMLVPIKDCNFVKRNDLIYKDTGVYCYYNAYSTKPVTKNVQTEEVVTTTIQIPGESKAKTVYILINPSDSAETRQQGLNDALAGIYCTIPQA